MSQAATVGLVSEGAMMESRTAQPPGDLIAALGVGTAALLILGIQPVLLEALVKERWIAEPLIGPLAMCEVAGLTLGSAAGARAFQALDMRWGGGLLALLIGGVDLLSIAAGGGAALFAARALCGLLEGGLLGVTIAFATASRTPERINAAFLAVQTVPQAMLAFLLPAVLIPRFGIDAAFLALFGAAALALMAAPLLPARPRPLGAEIIAGGGAWPPPVVIAVAGVVLQSAGIGAAWNFSTQLGQELRLSPIILGVASSGSLIVQILAATIVAVWLWRLPAARSLLAGALAQAVLVAAWPAMRTGVGFVSTCWVFGALLLGLGPYQVALLIRLQPSRRAALLLTTLTFTGWALGPLIASAFVRPDRCGPAFLIAASFFVASALAYAAAAVWSGRPAFAGATKIGRLVG